MGTLWLNGVKNLDSKSPKRKSAYFTEQNRFGLFGKNQNKYRYLKIFEQQKYWKIKFHCTKNMYHRKHGYVVLEKFWVNDEDKVNDEDEITLEFIPEIEEQKLSGKPQVQSCITQFFKNNKWLAQRRKEFRLIFFLKSFAYPFSHIFMRPQRMWLNGMWLNGASTVPKKIKYGVDLGLELEVQNENL